MDPENETGTFHRTFNAIDKDDVTSTNTYFNENAKCHRHPNIKDIDQKVENQDSHFDAHFLDAAFEEARLALKDGEVPVGCVFVKHKRSTPCAADFNNTHTTSKQSLSYDEKTSKIVARGRNTVNATKNATRHAEMNCIDIIHYDVLKEVDAETERNYYQDIDVYVNVEPCIQCCSALLQIGPPRAVYYGCANDRFGGCHSVLNVPKLLDFHNPSNCSQEERKQTDLSKWIFISGGHRSDESVELLKTFYKGENPNAPPDKRKPARN